MPELPQLVYRPVGLVDCKKLVLAHHYSHRLPSNVQVCYAHLSLGPPRCTHACAIVSIPSSRWPEVVWEVTRLVRMPLYANPLTKLVSKMMGHIRQHKLVDLIVSFADALEDHHGGIYQACSWVYDGMRGDRCDGFFIDGEFVPARTSNSVYGTSGVADLKKKLPDAVIEPHYDMGKHCYWKALTKKGMQKAVRLGLNSRPYPKPMLDGQSGVNYDVADQNKKGIVKLPIMETNEETPRRMDIGNEL